MYLTLDEDEEEEKGKLLGPNRTSSYQGGSRDHRRKLTQIFYAIKAASSWEDLDHILEVDGEHMTPKLVEFMVSRLPGKVDRKLLSDQRQLCDIFVARLLSKAQEVCNQLSAGQATYMLHHLGTLYLSSNSELIHGLLKVIHPHIPQLSPSCHSRTIYALGRLRFIPKDQEFITEMISDLEDKIDQCTLLDLTGILWGLARTKWRPKHSWIQQALFQIEARLSQAYPNSLSTLMVALVELKHCPEDSWVEQYLEACKRCLNQFKPAGLSEVALGLGKLKISPSRWDSAGEVLNRASALVHQMKVEQCCHVCWALAELDYLPPKKGKAICHLSSSIATQLPYMRMRHVSTGVSSLLKLGYQPSWQWADKVNGRVVRILHEDTRGALGSQLAVVTALFAAAGYKPDDADMELIMEATLARADSLGTADLVQLLHSLAVLDYLPPRPWWDQLLEVTKGCLDSASAEQLSHLVLSVGCINQQPPTNWWKKICEEVSSSLLDLSTCQAVNTIWGLARMDSEGTRFPDSLGIRLMREVLLVSLGACTPEEVARLCWAMARVLRARPLDMWPWGQARGGPLPTSSDPPIPYDLLPCTRTIDTSGLGDSEEEHWEAAGDSRRPQGTQDVCGLHTGKMASGTGYEEYLRPPGYELPSGDHNTLAEALPNILAQIFTSADVFLEEGVLPPWVLVQLLKGWCHLGVLPPTWWSQWFQHQCETVQESQGRTTASNGGKSVRHVRVGPPARLHSQEGPDHRRSSTPYVTSSRMSYRGVVDKDMTSLASTGHVAFRSGVKVVTRGGRQVHDFRFSEEELVVLMSCYVHLEGCCPSWLVRLREAIGEEGPGGGGQEWEDGHTGTRAHEPLEVQDGLNGAEDTPPHAPLPLGGQQ